ncbi:sigma factor-like helix-turn-helix DNA-binding protein [Cryptosporangium phraense]|uniref:RNA polymerase sigma factor 70 region 4 type 2 domain-containing protein n=1 Tax=Cryptosporangium phraense TaxID=2593070 RepID=A0A545ASV2_9ACTN|nr:sigma factor-like helix-turn-helix DNA-binding protein [Cryptosporangium phraense]TQS44331.1 hypothetical protein FL583_15475 [Cryptosporangium phraense]
MAGIGTIGRLSEALARLTPEQRRTVHLTGFEGFSHELVAMLTGLSVAEVRRDRAQALAALGAQRILRDDLDLPEPATASTEPTEGQVWEPLVDDAAAAKAGRITVIEVDGRDLYVRDTSGSLQLITADRLRAGYWMRSA